MTSLSDQGAADWQWFDHPGHLCVADRCTFHLHTHVRGYCVSTVGDFRPDGPGGRAETIGAGRLYETMVFRLQDDGEIDLQELRMEPYNRAADARAGHLRVCWEVERGNVG